MEEQKPKPKSCMNKRNSNLTLNARRPLLNLPLIGVGWSGSIFDLEMAMGKTGFWLRMSQPDPIGISIGPYLSNLPWVL